MAKKTYTDEFRAEAVRLVLETGRSVSDVAREIGIAQPTLSRWVKSQRDGLSDEQRDLRTENLRLQRELKQATMERDCLRDAAAYFAKQKR